MGSLPHHSWWERESPVPNRRQGLPHTESKMPTTSDVWKIIKHMVHAVIFMSFFAYLGFCTIHGATVLHGAAKLLGVIQLCCCTPEQCLRMNGCLMNLLCMKVASGGSSLDIPLPPQLSLPIDELQRRAEELEFCELLNQVQLPQCCLAALSFTFASINLD